MYTYGAILRIFKKKKKKKSVTSHLTIHRTTFSVSFGATSMAHCMGTSSPSTVFQPIFCGYRCGPSLVVPESTYGGYGTWRPSTLCTFLMFQHRGLFFVPDLTSGLKKTSQESSLTRKYRSTSRSGSSPSRVVSQDIADCTVVSTIRISASPLA